jgi:hypothetical protein
MSKKSGTFRFKLIMLNLIVMLISPIELKLDPKEQQHLYMYSARPDKESSKLKSYNWTFASRRAGLDQRADGQLLAQSKQDDAVVTAPIVYYGKTPHIILTLHNRPPLNGKRSGGLHWELVGGLTNDKGAQSSVWQTSDTEVHQETGLDIVDGEIKDARFKRLANSAGLTDETTRCEVRICTLPEDGFDRKKLDEIKEDTIMMAVAVPLKDAITFLHEQSEKDINVGLNTIAATTNAQRVLSIDSDHNNKNIEPKLLWDLKKSKRIKTQIQKEGFENPKYKEHYALAA